MKQRDKVVKKVVKEFNAYKKRLLFRNSKRNIFEKCNKIHFYCCVKEYFEENPNIPPLYIQVANNTDQFIEIAWRYYLKFEDLHYSTWWELERIFRRMVEYGCALIITEEESRHIMGQEHEERVGA